MTSHLGLTPLQAGVLLALLAALIVWYLLKCERLPRDPGDGPWGFAGLVVLVLMPVPSPAQIDAGAGLKSRCATRGSLLCGFVPGALGGASRAVRVDLVLPVAGEREPAAGAGHDRAWAPLTRETENPAGLGDVPTTGSTRLTDAGVRGTAGAHTPGTPGSTPGPATTTVAPMESTATRERVEESAPRSARTHPPAPAAVAFIDAIEPYPQRAASDVVDPAIPGTDRGVATPRRPAEAGRGDSDKHGPQPPPAGVSGPGLGPAADTGGGSPPRLRLRFQERVDGPGSWVGEPEPVERIADSFARDLSWIALGVSIDLGSTSAALRWCKTCREGNPLGWDVEARISLKLAMGTAGGATCYWLRRHGHGRAATIARWVLFGVQAAAATSNTIHAVRGR